MFYRDLAKIFSYYLFILAGVLCIPLFVGIYYENFTDPELHPQPGNTQDFIYTVTITLTSAVILYLFGRKSKGILYRREAFLLVVSIWFITPIFSGLPYYLSNTLSPCQSYFEATSGYCTCGATAMYPKKYDPSTGKEIQIQQVFCGSNTTRYTYYGTVSPVIDKVTGKVLYEGVEALGKGMLFWRSFTQWLGGGGIIVLFVAIFPAIGVGGKALYQTEVAGPLKEGLTPRIKETAIVLWKIYMLLTAAQTALLMFFNSDISLFNALTLTFVTISTGGFSNFNASAGHFMNESTEWIVMLFMVLGSINFSIYFNIVKGKLYRIYEPEFVVFIFFLIISCLLTAYFIVGSPMELLTGEKGEIFSVKDSIRYGFFQAISSLSTTGLSTANYDIWPYPAQVILLVIMFVGGMSGSTVGGFKILRIIMLFRLARYKTESFFRPDHVRKFYIAGKEVSIAVSYAVMIYFLYHISISVLGTMLFVFDGMDPQTAISLTGLSVNNSGMGFEMVGPTLSCAFLSNFSLILSSVLMLMGRLEFFAVFAILVPAFWKQNS